MVKKTTFQDFYNKCLSYGFPHSFMAAILNIRVGRILSTPTGFVLDEPMPHTIERYLVIHELLTELERRVAEGGIRIQSTNLERLYEFNLYRPSNGTLNLYELLTAPVVDYDAIRACLYDTVAAIRRKEDEEVALIGVSCMPLYLDK